MRKFWPYVGIALAVAGGLALAPYFWVIVLGAVILTTGYFVRRECPRVWAGLWIVGALLALAAWPLWLLSRGQIADAIFAAVLVAIVAGWRYIRPVLARIVS